MVNSMIRRLEGQYPAFLLDTDNTTYIFRVNASKHLEHLYYGKKITVSSLDDLFAITQKREFQLGNVICYSNEDKTEILEDVCLEISSLGKGDIREPFIELVHSDGSTTCDFVFSDAEISNTKVPLESLPSSYSENGEVEHLTVTLCDKSYDIKLELHYCVYPECDCITRSAKIVGGAEAFKIKRLMSLQLDLFGDDYSVTSFHGAWAREMQKSTLNLSSGKFVIESRAGVSSSRANPFFMVHNKNTTENYGDCFGFNLIYSGNHYEVNAYSKTRIVSGINPCGFEFTIEPGGVFESPEAVMTFSPNGFTGQVKICTPLCEIILFVANGKTKSVRYFLTVGNLAILKSAKVAWFPLQKPEKKQELNCLWSMMDGSESVMMMLTHWAIGTLIKRNCQTVLMVFVRKLKP